MQSDEIDQTQREMHAAFVMLDRIAHLMTYERVRVAFLNQGNISVKEIETARAGLARAMARRRHAQQIIRDTSKSNPNAR